MSYLAAVAGTAAPMSEMLNELLTRMYSDEGTAIGKIGTALWPTLYEELEDWLVRPN